LNNTLRGNNYGATLETSISTGGVSSKPLMGGVARSQNTAAEFNWMTLQMFDTLWFHQVTGSPSIRSYGVSSTGLLEQFKQWVTPGHRFRYLIWIDAANGLNFLINGKYFNVGHSRAALPSSATLRWGGQGNAGSGTYGNAAHGVALWGLADNITDAKIRALDVYLATWAKGF
jgi:hypothetical protein